MRDSPFLMFFRRLLYAVLMVKTESQTNFTKRRKLTYADPALINKQISVSGKELVTSPLNTFAAPKPQQQDRHAPRNIIFEAVLGLSIASAVIAGVMVAVPWLVTDAQDHNAKYRLSDIAFIEAANSKESYLPLSELKNKENISGDKFDSNGVSITLRKDLNNPDIAVGYTATIVSKSGKHFQINENHSSFDDIKEVKSGK
jgi:hypothetical protein